MVCVTADGPEAHHSGPRRYKVVMEITGRTALVTGAGIGTGRAIALALAAEGADVVASDVAPDQWGATLDLNLRAPMLATQLALPRMRQAGGGAIVNVASTAGWGSEPYQSPEYGAAKAGLIRFTSALGAIDGIRVNCIVPDWVATERVTAEERATTPPPIPLATVAEGVIRLIRDDSLAGRALLLWRGAEPRLA
jgi:NAD(P)-dependent dehydrogenase (short-subunit alcohol dehydrogenase family)